MSTANQIATAYLNEFEFQQMWVAIYLATLAVWLASLTLTVFSMQGTNPTDIQRLGRLMQGMILAPVAVVVLQPALTVGLQQLRSRLGF